MFGAGDKIQTIVLPEQLKVAAAAKTAAEKRIYFVARMRIIAANN